jgi:hypothetical protein
MSLRRTGTASDSTKQPFRRLFARPASPRFWFALFVFGVAVAMASWVFRPVRVGPVGSDTASAVLYFERLARGEQLELFLGTTPKPLIELVYGPVYGLFGDWRAISWFAILVYGAGVSVNASFVLLVTRSWSASVFAAVALIVSAGLLQDAALAYSVSWAFLFWGLAGVALAVNPGHYRLAGGALLLATLARPETLSVTATAAVVVAIHPARASISGRGAARAALGSRILAHRHEIELLLIAACALPIYALHDWRLAGDPLYSLVVPALATEIRSPQAADTAIRIVRDHSTSFLLLWPLALLGLVRLVRRGAWPILVGWVALGPGLALFIVVQGLRHIYVLDRYALPLDLATILAAAIGVSALSLTAVADRLAGRRLPRVALVLSASGLAALALSPVIAPLDQATLAAILADRQAIVDFEELAPAAGAAVDAIKGVHGRPAVSLPTVTTPSAPPALLVSARYLSMAAVQFDLPLTQVQRLDGGRIRSDGSYPSPGEIVVHDARLDGPQEAYQFLQRRVSATVGALRLVPIAISSSGHWWVIRVEAAD